MNGTKRLCLLAVIFGCLTVALLFISQCFYLHNMLNSDLSSELVLAKQLADRGQILSDNWYYSTELRVVNTQLITALLFKFTDNWGLVRVLSNFILYAFCAASMIFLGKSLRLSKQSIVLCEFLLIVPYSSTWFSIVQMGAFYYPHIILMFLALGSLFFSQNKKICFLIWCFVSLLMGMGGLRYLLIFHIPALCAGGVLLVKTQEFSDLLECLNKEKWYKIRKSESFNWIMKIAAGCLFACLGWVINDRFWSLKYEFQNHGGLTYRDFGETGESVLHQIGRVMMGIPEVLGYRNNVLLFSKEGIFNSIVLIFVLTILIILVSQVIKLFSQKVWADYKTGFLLLLLTFSFFANLYIVVFMRDNYSPRYWIVVLIWLIPLLGIFINNERPLAGSLCVCVYLVLFYAFIAGAITMSLAIGNNHNATRYGVNRYLMNQKMEVGYSTFWNANITTELTNGKIKMISLNNEMDFTVYKWLTPKDSYQYERGKTKEIFVLLDRRQFENIYNLPADSPARIMYDQGQVDYLDDYYAVIVFKSQCLDGLIKR